eukprot:05913.XXX_119595_119277_1 [CDS] Oithona nana genome sequencing.
MKVQILILTSLLLAFHARAMETEVRDANDVVNANDQAKCEAAKGKTCQAQNHYAVEDFCLRYCQWECTQVHGWKGCCDGPDCYCCH